MGEFVAFGTLVTVIIVAVVVVALIVVAAIFIADVGKPHESPQKMAGRVGERVATRVLSETMEGKDWIITNVRIYADGKQAELDNVIVNENGVFIVETKNYSGMLFGTADDYEWLQTKESAGGNYYQKPVKNPIKQVNRQVYILSRVFKDHGIHVWIDGYVILVNRNSPIHHRQILDSRSDINRVIHCNSGQRVSAETQDKIRKLLRQFKEAQAG